MCTSILFWINNIYWYIGHFSFSHYNRDFVSGLETKNRKSTTSIKMIEIEAMQQCKRYVFGLHWELAAKAGLLCCKLCVSWYNTFAWRFVLSIKVSSFLLFIIIFSAPTVFLLPSSFSIFATAMGWIPIKSTLESLPSWNSASSSRAHLFYLQTIAISWK